MLKLIGLVTAVFFLSSAASAFTALKEEEIAGWTVKKFQTENSGISCQALKCDSGNCQRAQSSILLWGSANRKAITPQIGANFAANGAQNAEVVIDSQRFKMTQSKTSRFKRFIAQDTSDDAKIIDQISRNERKTLRFVTEKGEARFTLKGARRIFAFFEKECGIPSPKKG